MQLRRFRLKTIAPLASGLFLFILFSASIILTNRTNLSTIQNLAAVNTETITNTSVDLLFNPVNNFDIESISSIVNTIVNDSNAAYIAVRNLNGDILKEAGNTAIPDPRESAQLVDTVSATANNVEIDRGDFTQIVAPIKADNTVIGTLEIFFDNTRFISEAEGNLRAILWVGGLAFLVAITGFITVAGIISRYINQITTATDAIRQGDLDIPIEIRGPAELAELTEHIVTMRDQIRENIQSLESRIETRTSELETQNQIMEASAQISRATASILNPNDLIDLVVELIKESFDLYYVGLFLTGNSQEWALLRAGTGEAGQKMLSRQHRIRVGEGMVGWTIANNQFRVSGEAEDDFVRLATSELSETQSEAALPIRSRGRVLGALTIQSTRPDAFNEQTITLVQTMVDQVALSLDNARLFSEAQETLQKIQESYQKDSRESWAAFLPDRESHAVGSTPGGTKIIPAEWDAISTKVLQSGHSFIADPSTEDDFIPLVIPIKVRDIVVGVIKSSRPASIGRWDPDEIQGLETISNQLGIALESARLFENTQARAQQERIFSESTSRIRESLDIDTILRTASEEIRKTLNLNEVHIQMSPSQVGGNPDNGK